MENRIFLHIFDIPFVERRNNNPETIKILLEMKKYVCVICGYVYDPAVGDEDSGIAPGTAFEDLPADWVCPLCGVGKEDFKPVE